MSNSLKIVLRIGGMALVLAAFLGGLPLAWRIVLAAAGFAGIIAGGGGG